MSNPWLKKNPFMSIWLSAANRMASTMRGQAAAQLARHPVQGTHQAVDLVGAPSRCRHRTSGVRGHPGQGEIGAQGQK